MAVVEDALQAETVGNGGMNRARRSATSFTAQHDALHFENVFFDDVEAVAGRVGSGVFGVEEGEQHAAGLEDGPEAPHDRTDEALVEVIRQIPAQHDIETRGGIQQVIGEKLPAVEDDVALFVFGDEVRLGGCDEQIFAVNFVTAFGEEADVGGRS